MAWLAYEKAALETGFNIQTMFDGFNELKAFVQRRGGEMLQPKEAVGLHAPPKPRQQSWHEARAHLHMLAHPHAFLSPH